MNLQWRLYRNWCFKKTDIFKIIITISTFIIGSFTFFSTSDIELVYKGYEIEDEINNLNKILNELENLIDNNKKINESLEIYIMNYEDEDLDKVISPIIEFNESVNKINHYLENLIPQEEYIDEFLVLKIKEIILNDFELMRSLIINSLPEKMGLSRQLLIYEILIHNPPPSNDMIMSELKMYTQSQVPDIENSSDLKANLNQLLKSLNKRYSYIQPTLLIKGSIIHIYIFAFLIIITSLFHLFIAEKIRDSLKIKNY